MLCIISSLSLELNACHLIPGMQILLQDLLCFIPSVSSEDETQSQTYLVNYTGKLTPKPKWRGKSKDTNFKSAITILWQQQIEEVKKITKIMLDTVTRTISCTFHMRNLLRKMVFED